MKKEIKESRKSMEAIRREEGREGGSKGGGKRLEEERIREMLEGMEGGRKQAKGEERNTVNSWRGGVSE